MYLYGMTNNIENYINEINRLMKYDRSKTIIEQQKKPVGPRADVEVGDISSTIVPNDIKVGGYGENSFIIKDFSGSEFGYPENCNSDFVLEGDETKPAIEGYCIYRGFDNKKIYINEKDKVWFITNSNELLTMWYDLTKKYPIIDEWPDEKQNEFYDFLKKGYEFGTVRQIKSNNQNYIARYKFNNGFWGFSGLFNKGGQSYNEPKVTRVKDGWEIYRHELTRTYLDPYIFDTLDSVAEFLCGEDSVLHDVWTLKIGNVIEYPLEELACDLLAAILLVFGPFGIAASISIEAAHARVLYKKGEKFGAAVSLILGMLPLVGDVTAIALRKLTAKIGMTGFTKVIGVINNLFRFYSGELKTTQIVKSILTLSKEERKVFFEICSKMSYYINKMDSWSDILIDLGKGFDEKGINIMSESIEKIAKLFETSKSLVGFGRWILDTGSQIGGVMGLILGVRGIAQLTDNKVMTEEEVLEIFDEMTDEEFYNFMKEFTQSTNNNIE